MISISPEDERVLQRSIRRGEAVLFLGAGASATSLSKAHEPILQGKGLAAKLAEMAGFEFKGEPLPKVLTAVLGTRVSRAQFESLLKEEFTLCEPSQELKALMGYTWARLYTWNLDDAVLNCGRPAQRVKPFNGMVDRVEPNGDFSFLQAIYLHGEALKPNHGYIFTEDEYSKAIARGHAWYQQAASDYAENVPIFIGSTLNEPILALELEKARPGGGEGLGVAFLVSPDDFTEIDLAAFSARGITVLKGTLADFIHYLRENLRLSSVSPTDVAAERNETGKQLIARGGITKSDIATAQYLRPITDAEGSISIKKVPADSKSVLARQFLEGRPPTWEIVYSGIPIELAQVEQLLDQFLEAYENGDRLFAVFGQSGSGKTTAIMQVLLKFAKAHAGTVIYELSGNTPSLRDAVALLRRLHPEDKIVVYVGESFAFGDSFAEDVLSVEANRILFVGDARTSEWKNHFRRRLQDVSYRSFNFQRFGPEDYQDLSDAITKYVPAPRFHRLSPKDRLKEFEKSNSQLLIALKEATHAERFKTVIKREYEGLPNDDVKLAFLISGLATLARSGISHGMAREVYEGLYDKIPFNSALSELEGLVFEDRNGRLIARHEIYVRHIIEYVASADILHQLIIRMLGSFIKYGIPIIKNVGRQDGILFKFMLNHNFLRQLFLRKGRQEIAGEIYSRFEVDFQLDGHFWLQYGQYLSASGQLKDALPILEKSIQAYPENDFAKHALADIQLKVAAASPYWNSSTMELVGHAVSVLEELHANRSSRSDQYPITTLADRHIDVLVKHGQIEEARRAGKRYFEEICDMPVSSDSIEHSKARLLHFLTHGDLSAARAIAPPKKHHSRKRH